MEVIENNVLFTELGDQESANVSGGSWQGEWYGSIGAYPVYGYTQQGYSLLNNYDYASQYANSNYAALVAIQNIGSYGGW